MGWIKYDDNGGNGTGWFDPSTISLTKAFQEIREANATALWHVAHNDSWTIMSYLEVVAGWDMKIPLKEMSPDDRAFCEEVAAWDGIDILYSFFLDNNLSIEERVQVIELLKDENRTVEEVCSLFLSSKTAQQIIPAITTVAPKNIAVDYLALYEAKYGVNLRDKAENGGDWYMNEVYPFSLNDWAAQQLGYALPNTEEVEAVSF